METVPQNINNAYLKGGGEMGELVRHFNWSQTSLGAPHTWPQSLLTTVSNLLRSRFPMFLWWGNNMIQFYNDAYRPSLGVNGKHPAALGQKGIDCWQEIWPVIYPLIEQVKNTGEATWNENQLIPIYRNGVLEDVYWTFSYSLVLNDDGNFGGVLVTCMETTESVQAHKSIEESEKRFRSMIEQAPVAIGLTRGEDFIFESINVAMLEIIGKKTKDDVLQKKLVDVLPELTAQPVYSVLQNVLQTGNTFRGAEVAVDMVTGGILQTRYYNITNSRIVDNTGEPFILHMAVDVTAPVIARRQIEQNEAKLRSILNSAPTAMGVFRGVDLVVENPNQFMIELLGQGPELEGKSFRQLLSNVVDEGQRFIEIIDTVRSTGQPFEANEVEVFFKVGANRRYFNITFTPLKDETGEVYAVLDISVDVTDQVLSRKKIEESEHHVRTLVDNAPFPIGVYAGEDLKIMLANEAIMKAWGKGNEVVGKLYTDVLPELANQEIFEKLRHVVRTGEGYHAKNSKVDLVVDGSKQTFYFNYSFTPLYDGQGEVYGVMSTAADVTELNTAHQKLAQSEKNLRSIVLQSPVAMCILKEPAYIVEIANERMFEIWGKTAAEVMNKPIFEGLPEAKEQGLEDLLLHVYTSGETFRALEMPINLPRGGKMETTYLNFVYEPFYDMSGDITGIIAVAIEVTEQVMARQKIEEVVTQRTQELAAANETLSGLNNELQRSNAHLEEFAHAASHDLKEPIRKITFFTHQLKSQMLDRLADTEMASLNRIENASQRMGSLIDDLLLYSHVSHKPHETEVIDLNAKLLRVLEDLELDIAEKKATVVVGKLPLVQGYRRQIQQLFQNLISNALKYSKAEVSPHINISGRVVEQDGQRFNVITVTDNGIGFDQQYAEKIFQMFSRLHGKGEYSGTGVGLAIVKKVVENHLGFIKANSHPGEGSTFEIYLPVAT